MDLNNKSGKKIALNVVSGKSNKHQGFGSGTIDLSNLSCVIIDGDEAYIDIGALHAKSKVERGIRFSANKEDVPNGRKCWVVWVAVAREGEGPYYGGVTACEMLIDAEAKKGWKILADHVNRMDYAMKRRFLLEGLNDTEKKALKACLVNHNSEWFERSPEAFKEQLA